MKRINNLKKIKLPEDLDVFLEKQKELINQDYDAETEQTKNYLEMATPNELQIIGLAILNLKIKSIKLGQFGKVILTIFKSNFSEKAYNLLKDEKNVEASKDLEVAKKQFQLPNSKLQQGDNIKIYETGPVFSNSNFIAQGIIYRFTQYKIQVMVEFSDQFDSNNFYSRQVSLVQSNNEVTYKRNMKCIAQLTATVNESLQYEPQSTHLFQTLFYAQTPETINKNIKQQVLYDKDNDTIKIYDKSLNEQQIDAVKSCLSAQTFFLIHGPPGTGKTKTLCEAIYQAVSLKKLKILASAPSNIAVDNIMDGLSKKPNLKICRIGHPARVLNHLTKYTLDSLISSCSTSKIIRDCKKQYTETIRKLHKAKGKEEKNSLRQYLSALRYELKNLEIVAQQEVLDDIDVICCTTTGADDKIFAKYLKKTVFDIVAIDEAAQALEVSTWIPLLRGRRAILAGDHKQLPPTIKSREAEKSGLNLTLFDRLIHKYPKNSQILQTQYRMNELIMSWSSEAVYKSQLIASPLVANHRINNEYPVLLMMNTANCQMGESQLSNTEQSDELLQYNTSRFNVGESDLVKIIYDELKLNNLKDKDIGIITPYSAQVDQIRKVFQKFNIDLTELEISTVDGFQGREKEAIIISMVRSNPQKSVGFLSDYRRMNVAITRAKKFVGLVGDQETVSSDDFLKQLIDYFNNNAEVRTAMEYYDQMDVRFNIGNIEISDKQKSQQAQQKMLENIKAEQPNQENKKKKKKKKKKDTELNQSKVLSSSQQKTGNQKVIVEENKTNFDLQKLVEQNEQEQREENEKIMKQLKEKLEAFKSSNDESIELSNLTPLERKIIHSLADNYKLYHQSKGGNKKNKIIIISKINISSQKNDEEQKQKSSENQISKAEKRKNQKKKKKEESKTQSIQDQVRQKQKEELQNMNEDDYLTKLIQIKNHCQFVKENGNICNEYIEVLGHTCFFCKERYCMKHALAEVHGCGNKASVHAKEQFRQQAGTFGSLKCDQQTHDQLKQKLQRKIQKKTESRQQQKPKKKK